MPAGGIMFEKVLKRLCPCYFNRKNKNDTASCPHKSSDSKQTASAFTSTGFTSTEAGRSTTTNSNMQDSWKGTLNLVQPQPVYAFPLDLKKTQKKKTQKNLLKPPLYWKKATKSLYSEGPPVFEESRNVNFSVLNEKSKKRKTGKPGKRIHLKHSETVADITSVTTPSTVEVRWLKSQSLDNVFFEASSKKITAHKKIKNRRNGREDWNSIRGQILRDISHGVIYFTAAYFNKRKTCMINIDRLENLSKKGREGNSYYSVIKLAVLPSEKYVKCTKILSNCCSPEVKQDFSFSVKELTGKVLRFSVFDASLQKQHEAVGHALLTLEDIVSDQPKRYRIKLYKRSQPHICPGNLWLSLNYFEVEDKFGITVYKARNLSLQKVKNAKLNTYVKVTLYSYGEKVKTKKSIVVLDSRDPNYNSTFTFQVRKDQIDYLSVSITVRLKGFVNDLTIGRLNFGPFFYVESKKLSPWGRVFLNKELVSHWFRMYL